jgi:pimeloyl-ACP methyl ester carboxylesterase
MPTLVPFMREAGQGSAVVCLHSNASTSSQWRVLMDRLAPSHRVVAIDSIGAGKSPPWPDDAGPTLSDEAAFLEPVLAAAAPPFFLIGHSYGAAVALVAALARPERIRALVLYEPPLIALLEAEAPGQAASTELRRTAADAAASIAAGDTAAAARRFIDYWMGAGSWDSMPAARQTPIAVSMAPIARWARALVEEPTPLAAFQALDMPVLFMVGSKSPASSRGVARLLMKTLPNVTVMECEGLGHMGPVTHPDVVNDRVAGFLARH